MLKKILSTAALAVFLVCGGTLAAHASTSTELTAEPSTIEVGEQTTLTATGLGDLATASFGLDGTPGGTLVDPSGAEVSQYDAPVTNGEATIGFRASQAGDFTVAVGDGETVIATRLVTVTLAPSPEPAPTVTVTQTVSPEPTPEPTMTTMNGGDDAAELPVWAIVLIVVLAVVVVGAVVTIVVLVTRRRRTATPRE